MWFGSKGCCSPLTTYFTNIACIIMVWSTNNIARSDLCRHRRGKRLKGTEAPFFFIVEREIAKSILPSFPETADLDETGPDRKKQPCPDQQNDQHIVRKVLIDQRNNIL